VVTFTFGEDGVPSSAEVVVSPMLNPEITEQLHSSCEPPESAQFNLLKFIDIHKMAQ